MSYQSNLRVSDPALTQLVRGPYKEQPLAGIVLAPIVDVPGETGKIPVYSDEELKVFNTERAMGQTKANIIPPESATPLSVAMSEHDASFPVDYRQIKPESRILQQQRAALVARRVVMRRMEKIIADKARTAANYTSDNTVTLAGNDQWSSTHADSAPLVDIETGRQKILANCGAFPNLIVLGPTAWAKFAFHSTVLDRIKYTNSQYANPQLVAALLDIKTVIVGAMSYKTDAGVRTEIWGDDVVMAYVPEMDDSAERSIYDPAFMNTVRKTGMPEADIWYSEDGKVEYARYTDIFDVIIRSQTCGYLIKDVAA